MDLDALKSRLKKFADEACREGEQATVIVGTRTDIPAWSSEVCWSNASGLREWTGFAGRLEDLEQNTIIQIVARKQRIEEEKSG